MTTYINPDALLLPVLLRALLGGLSLRLCCDKRKHVLPALQENLPGSIICTGLLLIEALEGILLGTLFIAVMRFDEAGVEEEQERLEEARSLVAFFIIRKEFGKQQAAEGDRAESCKGDFGVEVEGQHHVTTKRSHGILSSEKRMR